MIVDFTRPICDLDGKPFVEGEDPQVVTLAKVSINSLLTPLADAQGRPETLDGETKVRLATLAQAIHKNAARVTLTLDDAALIKQRIGRAYAPLAVMQAWALLEGGQDDGE